MYLWILSLLGKETPSIQGFRVRRCLCTANSGLAHAEEALLHHLKAVRLHIRENKQQPTSREKSSGEGECPALSSVKSRRKASRSDSLSRTARGPPEILRVRGRMSFLTKRV